MKADKLSKYYNNQKVFSDISIKFEKGKIYSIFGKNGVGKTTLLNILNGNLKPDSGTVTGSLETIFLENNTVPFEFMTADEFIDETFKFKKVPLDRDLKKTLYSALQFNPEEKLIKEFSKGMKSKLYIIIAFLSKAEVLLLDEPFTDIDLYSFKVITAILRAEKNERTTIFSTHVSKIAFELSDYIVYLSEDCAKVVENQFASAESLENYVLEEMVGKVAHKKV